MFDVCSNFVRTNISTIINKLFTTSATSNAATATAAATKAVPTTAIVGKIVYTEKLILKYGMYILKSTWKILGGIKCIPAIGIILALRYVKYECFDKFRNKNKENNHKMKLKESSRKKRQYKQRKRLQCAHLIVNMNKSERKSRFRPNAYLSGQAKKIIQRHTFFNNKKK